MMSVPPGFRFHPTDEELLYYYLRKKVSYEAIDLDVIREVDLNKLEPWDLKDKCKIGSGPQNEWYFFSHKDKKYPTGTRTNRATTAGFWKATGRDKAIHLSDSTRIGMRKTLVFYIGRAPQGQKTEWIMHEYRLDDDNDPRCIMQEEGWVVCRVFKKKNQSRGLLPEVSQYQHEDGHEHFSHQMMKETAAGTSLALGHDPKRSQMMMAHQQQQQHLALYSYDNEYTNAAPTSVGATSMHLPQLLSPETAHHHHHHHAAPASSFFSADADCSQNLLMRLTTSSADAGGLPPHAAAGDWSFLDKLLALNPHSLNKTHSLVSSLQLAADMTPQKYPLSYLAACENDPLKFSK